MRFVLKFNPSMYLIVFIPLEVIITQNKTNQLKVNTNRTIF